MTKWVPSKSKVPGPSRGGPVVHLSLPLLAIQEIQFANTKAKVSFYVNNNSHPIAKGDLKWWARGAKITTPEWVRGRSENFPACLLRQRPVELRVKLVGTFASEITLALTATPTLNGNDKPLSAVTQNITYAAGASEQWVDINFGGTMPDEVGQFVLRIDWSASGNGFQLDPMQSEHRIFAIYDDPFDPAHDSPDTADPGVRVRSDEGTRTGTPKRFDKLVQLFGPSRRHSAATANDVIDLLWKLHVGINDTPGAPPYFDAGHDEHLTDDGSRTGTKIPLEDQWLAWIPTSGAHWNDASCIGHVQILKTMVAAIGLFARRAWVYPSTSKMPDGSLVSPIDTDLYALGTHDPNKRQSHTFSIGSESYLARPKLMEPGGSWENFEACLLSPNGRFLPGGYETSSLPADVRASKGFRSATDLIRWWANTSRPGFGKRFICWVFNNPLTGESHFWDVDGKHYTAANYVQIRERGKQLPPP